MNNLSSVVTALNAEVARLGGEDKAMEACERMYSADFRSEPVSIKDYEALGGEVDKHELFIELATKAYCKATGKPEIDYENAYFVEIEMFEDCVSEWAKSNLVNEINGETLIVDIVNYKGEAEGIALYSLTERLPVFVNKASSFDAANRGF